MAMLCIFGFCIPYSVLWPLVAVLIKEVWTFFMGKASNEKKKEAEDKENKKNKMMDATSHGSETEVEVIEKVEVSSGYLGHISSEEHWRTIVDSDKLVFAKFTAKWCKPCKAIDPVYLEVAEQKKEEAVFVQIDVDEYDQIAAENRALAIPLVVCYKDGKRVDSKSGNDVEQLRLFVDESVKLHSVKLT